MDAPVLDTCDAHPVAYVTAIYAYDESGAQIGDAVTQCGGSYPTLSSDPSVRYDVVVQRIADEEVVLDQKNTQIRYPRSISVGRCTFILTFT